MCHFITMILPASAPSPSLRRLADVHALALTPYANPSIDSQLIHGEYAFYATRAACDCGTELGAGGTSEPPEAGSSLDPDATRLRRKGWSDAKIDRWIQQKTVASRNRARRARTHGTPETPGAADWARFLGDALATGIDRVGLMLHWYKGDVRTEEIRFQRETVAANEISTALLRSIEEDVLYEFRS